MAGQLVLTFIVGSLFYAVRRLSGTLILCIFLHGLWDSATFLTKPTHSDPFPLAALIYPVAIVCAFFVIRRIKDARLPLG